jgi:hypothetical protein
MQWRTLRFGLAVAALALLAACGGTTERRAATGGLGGAAAGAVVGGAVGAGAGAVADEGLDQKVERSMDEPR